MTELIEEVENTPLAIITELLKASRGQVERIVATILSTSCLATEVEQVLDTDALITEKLAAFAADEKACLAMLGQLPATLIYDPKTWLRTEAGVNHGLRSANTNFLDYPNSNAFNFGAVARAEFKVMGNWKDYAQMGAVDVKDPLLVIGVGADYSERGHSGQTVGVVDIMYAAPSGLSIYGSFIDRYTNHNFGIYQPTITGANIAAPPASVLNRSTNEYAAVIQAGYLFGKHWEPYGRFEYIHVAGTAAGSKNYIPVIAGGVNYYFFGHKCKMSAQLEYLPKGIPFDDTPNDLLASPSGKSEFSGTVQFQLFL